MGNGLSDGLAELTAAQLTAENARLRAEVKRLRVKCGEPEDDINPCPLCCSVAELSIDSAHIMKWGRVVCHKCGMRGPINESYTVAIQKWNLLKK